MCDLLSPEQLSQVAAPFRRSTASRLVEKHRGTRWLVEKAFQDDQEPQASRARASPCSPEGASGCAGVGTVGRSLSSSAGTALGNRPQLAHRRLESGAWKPWTPRSSSIQRSRAVPLSAELAEPISGQTLCRNPLAKEIREAEIAAAEQAAVGELGSRLRDTDEHIRWRALRALSALGEGAVNGAQASLLAGSLREDPEANVRWAAAEVLGRAGPATAAALGVAEAVQALATAEMDTSRSTQWEASDAKARVIAGAQVASPAWQAGTPAVSPPPSRVMLRHNGTWC